MQKKTDKQKRKGDLEKKINEKLVKKEKMSEDEKQKKLQEMMSNATWREDQRSKKVNLYRDEIKQEENENRGDHDPDFIRKQLNAVSDNSTVESRIKSNKYNIQRGFGNMDTNFAKRWQTHCNLVS